MDGRTNPERLRLGILALAGRPGRTPYGGGSSMHIYPLAHYLFTGRQAALLYHPVCLSISLLCFLDPFVSIITCTFTVAFNRRYSIVIVDDIDRDTKRTYSKYTLYTSIDSNGLK